MYVMQADVLRLLILKKYGGIYLDNDIFVVNNLDKYRK
jgi:mannosyltransferase OCH1-like enzyme